MEVAEPEGDETAPFVGGGEADEQAGADDADAVSDDHGGTARVVRPARADVAADDEGEELDGAAGDLEVLGTEGAEAKRADDDAGEGGDGGVGDLGADGHDEEDPGLGVGGGLEGLVLGEVAVLHALLVGSDAVDCDQTFSLGQELGGRGEIREDDE